MWRANSKKITNDQDAPMQQSMKDDKKNQQDTAQPTAATALNNMPTQNYYSVDNDLQIITAGSELGSSSCLGKCCPSCCSVQMCITSFGDCLSRCCAECNVETVCEVLCCLITCGNK